MPAIETKMAQFTFACYCIDCCFVRPYDPTVCKRASRFPSITNIISAFICVTRIHSQFVFFVCRLTPHPAQCFNCFFCLSVCHWCPLLLCHLLQSLLYLMFKLMLTHVSSFQYFFHSFFTFINFFFGYVHICCSVSCTCFLHHPHSVVVH